ncbi:MAG: hypothetical protein IT438_07870 [Phycisphaerales bacterium]|nr:hypothetical protein [Phycisphaerales bacterium]
MLQVFHEDDPNDSTNNIGLITIFGQSGILSVLIGGDSNTAVFPDVTDLIDPACHDFAGLVFDDAVQGRATQATIWVANDITGPVTVGRISRIDAARNIDGDITATVTSEWDEFEFLIERIGAGNRIAGDITGVGQFSPYKSIDLIVVGPSLTAEGITGDIKNELGRIERIFTTGKIGTSATQKSAIRAGVGITEIRAISLGGTTVLDRDIFADIRSNLSGSIDTSLVSRALNKLHTAGDFVGSIDVDFIRPRFNPGPDGLPVPGLEWGIIVGGAFTGDIKVRHSVLKASIGAGTFTAPTTANPDTGHIVVDHALDGPIVATNSDGYIHSISVGRNPFPEGARSGFVGTQSEPQTKPFVPWRIPTTGRLVAVPNLPTMPDVPPAPDCLIAANSIGSITISAMYRANFKAFVPRIESPTIGTLVIDDMREGVVWSGNLEYDLDTNGFPEIDSMTGRAAVQDPTDHSNDYATIGTLTLGCVGPGADVWFQGTPQSNIAEHLLGELYLPALAASEQVRIGKRLGSASGQTPDTCPCTIISPEGVDDCVAQTQGGWPVDGVTDDSPRHMRGEEMAEVGTIRIASATGLAGQVIVRQSAGEDTDAQAWSGQVIVGDGTGTPVVLAPESASPDEGPYYKRVSSELGNGAVGLAPFHLYEADCVPRHDREESTAGIFEGDVNNGSPVRARFFGPIKLGEGETSWSDVLTVHCRPFGANECNWIDVTNAWVRSGPSSSATSALDRRTITLTRASTYHIAPGVYLLQPVYEEAIVSRDLSLDKAAVWPMVCVGSEEVPGYAFIVYGDCDEDETPDHLDGDLSTCEIDCHIADFNHSGMVTVQDIFDFLDQFFRNCTGVNTPPNVGCWRSADVNNAGGVTIQDLFDFLGAYFSWHDCE